ncbi:MAG: hypothetical protein K6T83_10540 [Alicyclobacillus sp.]|nr:hypothetical protein [Alicyclobacillus sp.]
MSKVELEKAHLILRNQQYILLLQHERDTALQEVVSLESQIKELRARVEMISRCHDLAVKQWAAESHQLRTNLEILGHKLAEKDRVLSSISHELFEIKQSVGWRVIESVRAAANAACPPGTIRHKILQAGKESIRRLLT